MGRNYVNKKVTATILSMSLLTVMAGAAIAPALMHPLCWCSLSSACQPC